MPFPRFPRSAPALVALAWAAALPAAQAQVQAYDIAPQALDATLAQIARQGGVQLVLPAELAQGRQAPAVRGQLAVGEALARALQGSGLEAQRSGSTVVVRPVSRSGGALGEVRVTAQADVSGTSEGTGRYAATGQSSTATRLGMTAQETPQSISVLTRQRLDDQKLGTVGEVINATVGLSSFSQGIGTDLSQPYARGFTVSNYLVDGVPSVSSSGVSSRINTAMYDRVEVVRGATGMLSGMGTPGAAINLVRKRPTVEPQSQVSVEAGSWSRYGAVADISRPLNDAGTARGRLVVDVKDRHSFIDRYQSQSQMVYGVTEFDLGRATRLTAGFDWQDDRHDAPMRTGIPVYYSDGSRIGLPRGTNNAPDWSYYNTSQGNAFATLDHRFDQGWSGALTAGGARTRWDAMSYYQDGAIDATTGLGSSIAPSKWKGDTAQVYLEAHANGPFTLWGRTHDLAAGLTWSRSTDHSDNYGSGGWLWTWNSDYRAPLGDVRTYDGRGVPYPEFTRTGSTATPTTLATAYLTSRWAVSDSTRVILGARHVNWKRDATTTAVSGTQTRTQQKESGVIVPYAGVVQQLNGWLAAYASTTQIFTPQGASVRDINNQPLDPEEGSVVEAGLKATMADGRLHANLAVFKAKQDKLAEYDAGTSAYRMVEGINTRGAEVEFSGELARGWNLSAGYAYSLSENKQGQRAMHRIPRHNLKLFTTYRLPGEWNRLTIGGGLNGQSRFGWEGGEYAFQGSFAVARLMLRYDVSPALDLTLNVENLFDRLYYVALLDNGTYGAPRNAMLTARYRF